MEVQRLRSVRFFPGLSTSELERLTQWADEVSVPAGHELAREGQFAHEFFVIEEGTAAVVQEGGLIAELDQRDFFGKIGLLETERRTAPVVARTPMRLIVMFQREFRQMVSEMPTVADRIRSAIRVRLET